MSVRPERTDAMSALADAVCELVKRATAADNLNPAEVRLGLAHACAVFINSPDEFAEFGDDIKKATIEMDLAIDAKRRG